MRFLSQEACLENKQKLLLLELVQLEQQGSLHIFCLFQSPLFVDGAVQIICVVIYDVYNNISAARILRKQNARYYAPADGVTCQIILKK